MIEHKLGKLEAVIEDTASGPVCIAFRGESEGPDAAQKLRGLFDQYFDVVANRGLQLDFRSLDYMNSSTFPPIVEVIRRLHQSGASIKVLYSKDKAWQRTPFSAISAIASVYDNLSVQAC
jgi:hypothetical protein